MEHQAPDGVPEYVRTLTPAEAASWAENPIDIDWDHTGPGQEAEVETAPAPVASEVANRPEAPAPRPRRRTAADAKQEARDNSLVLARHAKDLLASSIEWAEVDDPGSADQAAALMEAVDGWVRTRSQRAKPRPQAQTVFDHEVEGITTKEGV